MQPCAATVPILFSRLGYGNVLMIACLWLSNTADALAVPTSSGDVDGMNVTYNGTIVTQYLGIPYAAPPIGDLRFRRPLSHPGWNDTFNATEFGPSCMQYFFPNDVWLLRNRNISEDCLQLNIFIPRLQNGTSKKAVMVWIHGGGFTAGQATLFDASYLAVQGDVIVVTINYRLGVFGFLYTDDQNAPGNYGLWDQRLAIQWVKDNIEYFGGDSGKICIFGESAGGFSVGYQSLSPLNMGLFHKAIFESGAVAWLSDFKARTTDVAERLAQKVNCSATDASGNPDTKALVQCLRGVPSKQLLAAQGPASDDSRFTFVRHLGPVIDGEFVTGNPMDLFKNKSSPAYKMFTSVDVIAGVNNAEGGLMYFDLQRFQKQFNFNASESIPVRVLCDLIAPAVARDYYGNDTRVSSAICEQYKTNSTSPGLQTRNIADVFADVVFIVPTVMMLQAHSMANKNQKSFQYLFSHQPSDPWIQDRPNWLRGANHAGELPFVFGLKAMYRPTVKKPRDEMILSSQVMKYWSNFAKSG